MAMQSTMLDLGTEAPRFALPSVVSGRTVSIDDVAGEKALLVMFICRHCPYVKHVQDEIVRLGDDYRLPGVGIVAIGANDADTYPDDRPESLAEMATTLGFQFPFLHDATQEVARAYKAACTPDFFLFDAARRLVYRGQLDASRPNSATPVTGRDLRAAIDALIQGHPVDPHQRPSAGCGIKWKKGHAAV